MINYKKLADELNNIIPEIDKHLIKINVNINNRPSHVVAILMKHHITEIKNIKEETIIDLLFRISIKWYNNNYKESFPSHNETCIYGLTEIKGVLLKINAPKYPTTINTKTNNIRLLFTHQVNSNENIIKWIENLPNFNTISKTEISLLKKRITFIIKLLRKIHLDIMCSYSEDHEANTLLKGILPSLEDAAHKFLRGNSGEAFWELQMATERSLKALSQQRNKSYRKTHDIKKLYSDVQYYLNDTNFRINDKIIDHKTVMKMRYGNYGEFSTRDIIESYNQYIMFISILLDNTKKSMVLSNAFIELRNIHTDDWVLKY